MSFISIVVALFFVMDPLGNVPIFIGILNDVDPKRRTKILIRECVISLVVLMFFLFFGGHFLKLLSVSTPALSIAGAIVLFLISINMIFPAAKRLGQSDHLGGEPFIVPLAVPMIAGPSAISVLMIFSMQEPGRTLTLAGGLTTAWLLVSIILVLSFQISKFLGARIMLAITRLMGMILTAIAVEMLLKGISTFLK